MGHESCINGGTSANHRMERLRALRRLSCEGVVSLVLLFAVRDGDRC
jgi:hypothetical protein